jgi:DegV family protein with EDD domain
MPTVRVITDSTACLPEALAHQLDIDIIPLYLALGDRVYQDGPRTDAAEFYRMLRASPVAATTAAPPPGAYAEAMLRAAERADAVLCITVSRQFSAMYDAALQGAALALERQPGLDIRVLDSGSAAMGQGFVALEAARAAQEGLPITEVLRRAEALMPKGHLLVALDTLAYLARSGRVPRLIVWASSPLQVKPIVEFRRGSYRPIAIARTRPRAVERLVQALEQRAGRGLHLCIHHTNAPDDAQALAERLRAALNPVELFVSEFTKVMGVHTGPGLLGFAFYSEEEP